MGRIGAVPGNARSDSSSDITAGAGVRRRASVPADDILDAELRLHCGADYASRRKLTVSHVDLADSAFAEVLRMIERFRMEGGVEIVCDEESACAFRAVRMETDFEVACRIDGYRKFISTMRQRHAEERRKAFGELRKEFEDGMVEASIPRMRT